MTAAPFYTSPFDRKMADRAGRLLWVVFGLFLAAVLIGVRWDRGWHATHPFEDFWSPPHLFIYTTFTLAAEFLARLVVWPALRAHFGPVIGTSILPVRIPGALILACGGFALIGCGGLLDGVWHTAFGLDETGWSLPHAALGWGMLLTLIGLVACRMALRPHRDLSGVTRAFFGLLLLSALLGIVTGPLGNNNTVDMVRAIAALPVLAREPDAQRTFRIYVEAGLTRENALFVPLAAFAVGAGLALTQRVVRKGWLLVIVVAIFSLLSLSGERQSARYLGIAADARNWIPLPVLPVTLLWLCLVRCRVSESWAWMTAGAIFGTLVVVTWGASVLAMPFAVPAILLGAMAGRWIYDVMDTPAERGVMRLLLTFGTIPVVLGLLDLYLRLRTA